MELLVIVGVCRRFDLLGCQFIEFFLDGFGGGVGVITTDVDTSAGLRYLAAHLFVKTTDDDVSFAVLTEVIRSGHRDRTAFGFSDTYYQHLDTFFFGTTCDGHCIIFMVLSIGDEDDRTTGVGLLSKTTDRGGECLTDRRSLRLDEFGFDGVQEYLCGHVVASDR